MNFSAPRSSQDLCVTKSRFISGFTSFTDNKSNTIYHHYQQTNDLMSRQQLQ